MQRQLLGDVPGISLPLSKRFIRQAAQYIVTEQNWSFQSAENGWLTPGLLGSTAGTPKQSAGSITVAPYDTVIVGDAVATTLWASLIGRPFLTEMQIRVPLYSLYNIVTYLAGDDPDNPNAPFAQITIDRPWMEPAQVAGVYMIYQAYFPVPTDNFRRFTAMRDTTNNAPMDFRSLTQADLARRDPQRMEYDLPSYAVPYEVDKRVGSASLGRMMYELWPHPLAQRPYSFSFLWDGVSLVNNVDTVPYPLSEELVMWRAKQVAYQWKEAQLGDGVQRGSGADWRFLMQAANPEYMRLLKMAKLVDVELGDLYWNKFERRPTASAGYETTIGTLNVGTWGGG